jgi:hypothetical protein
MAQKNVLPQVPPSLPASVPGTSTAAGGVAPSSPLTEIRDGIRSINERLDGLVMVSASNPVEQALSEGRQLSAAIHARAASVKPVTIDDSQRTELERLFGGDLLHTGADVVKQVRAMTTLSINGAAIELPADTLARVDSRRPIDTTLVELLQAEVTAFLERYVDGSY